MRLIAYASLPLVIWASGLLLGGSSTRELVWLSAVGVGLAGALMLVATMGAERDDPETTPGTAAGWVMLATVFGALSPLVAVLAANRLAIPATQSFLWTGRPSALVLAVLGGIAGLLLGFWAWRARPRGSQRRMRVMLVVAQLVLPWGFLVVMPTPWVAGEIAIYGGPVSAVPWLVLVLVAVAYVDVIRRLPALDRQLTAARSLTHTLSPVAVAAALLFIKLIPISIQQLSPDDYHFGESLLPWYSLTAHGAVPFWDYVPARGLINYLDSAVAAMTFGSSAVGVAAAIGVVSALVVIVSLAAISSWIGVLPAAAAFLMLPLHAQLTQVDVLNTAALLLLFMARTRLTSTQWLVAWLIVGTAAFLMAPAQGSILVLATMPLGAWQVGRALLDERAALLRVGSVVGVTAVVLLFATPLGRMTVGAIRYAREHSAVSGPAHGIEWALSAGSYTLLNTWLFEAVRASWMLVGMCAIALLIAALVRRDQERLRGLVLVGVPVIIMAALFIYRAAGRIDPGTMSRLGFVSVWMVALMLPLLLHAAWGVRHWPLILTLAIAGSALLTPQLGGLLSLRAIGHRALESDALPSEVFGGFSKELQNLGGVRLDRGRVLAQIHRELGVLLEPDETYLDLTNRNAQYFYLGREVPIESGAIYNLPHDRQQLRSIERLKARQVPVVLALSDNLLLDGAPPSYRVHALYRYLIQRYVPVRLAERVYLVSEDRLSRFDRGGMRASREDAARQLDEVFRLGDLQGLPASWGASWASLAAQVSRVRQLGEPATVQGLRRLGGGEYAVDTAAAALTWDLGGLAGRDAGMLTFDYTCQAPAAVALEVRWAVPGAAPDPMASVRFQAAPRVAVPLDAAPRWLLAPAVGTLEIHVPGPGTCPRFSLSNATLWQRRIAAEADAH